MCADRRVHALGVLGLVLQIAVVEANGHNDTALGPHAAGDCGHGHGHDEQEIDRPEARVVVAMIVVMIQLSMVFEAGREAMKDHAGVELVDMVHALFSELALLGFIGFLAFVTIRIGLGEALSKFLGVPQFVQAERKKGFLEHLLMRSGSCIVRLALSTSPKSALKVSKNTSHSPLSKSALWFGNTWWMSNVASTFVVPASFLSLCSRTR